jgi:hypothetical protein
MKFHWDSYGIPLESTENITFLWIPVDSIGTPVDSIWNIYGFQWIP